MFNLVHARISEWWNTLTHLVQIRTGKYEIDTAKANLGDANENVDDNFAGFGKSLQFPRTIFEAQLHRFGKVGILFQTHLFFHFSRTFQLEKMQLNFECPAK